jgi:hypothetical protein
MEGESCTRLRNRPADLAPASPLDGLLVQLSEQSESARIRLWAARLLGGEAAVGATSNLPPSTERASGRKTDAPEE